MSSIVEYVRANVSPKAYYSKIFPDLQWPESGSDARVICIFHKDKDPSLHFNPESGAWYCHGCEAGGRSIISFHAKKENGLSNTESAEKIFDEMVHPIVPMKLIRKYHRNLRRTPSVKKFLIKERFFSPEEIVLRRIGWTGQRITFPVINQFGLCVNVKFYDPLSKSHKTPKMLNYHIEGDKRHFGSPPEIYPYAALLQGKEEGLIVVAEGEPDTEALLSLGIPTVTNTTGSKSWPSQYNEDFRGLKVYIAYDNDKDGIRYDRKVVLKNLRKVAKAVYRIRIPKFGGPHDKPQKDVTDWMRNDKRMRRRANWLREIRAAKLMLKNPDEAIKKSEPKLISLSQASEASNFNQVIKVDALVTGKDNSPYILPSHFRVSCNKCCENCPIAESKKDFKEGYINPEDSRVLSLVDSPEPMVRKLLMSFLGFAPTPKCGAKLEILKTFNLEHLLLIPTLESNQTSQYVLRPSYYVGHGTNSNRAYRFEGTTIPHPRDQHATHLFYRAKPAQDEIETFQLSNELKTQLKIFQPTGLSLMAHLMSIADWQSTHVTKILQRSDLHIAVDLVYHSTASFEFNREYVPRGMLDALIIGDTRCGKGYVTEGLKRYYGLGEVGSGENCSFAGLIGGIQQTARKGFFITWGLIPLNNGRLVVIDEASSLKEEEIGRMSRVRSEGIAEVVKIIRESTRANVRLIWLSNPRSGRKMETYDEGVQAIKELMGANEDISRFDFAMTVAGKEVPSEIINTPHYSTDTNGQVDKYPKHLCRALILWAWSRRPEQIHFTQKAEKTIINQAINFGQTYSPNIPLVQAENIRIKLAKISAAVAARVFSTDETGERLIIKSTHVECACDFLHMIYCKPSMAYDVFSKRAQNSSTIQNKGPISKVFDSLGNEKKSTIEGMLELHRITAENLADYAGDIILAKTLIGELVRLHCLSRIENNNWYLKNPEFTDWLKRNRKDQRHARID